MKYFEIPASKSLLVSNFFDELGDLGFIPDENMVAIDYENLDSQMKRLRTSYESIAQKGYDLIREKHSTIARAKELIEWLRKI